jgi:ribosomal protein L6P/L9E
MLIKVKDKFVNIPENLNLIFFEKELKFYVENTLTKENCFIILPPFLTFKKESDFRYKFFIKEFYLKYYASKMMLYTFVSKFQIEIKGISESYKGTINIKGLGYSVAVTKLENNKHSLFFRFGFKDKFTYIMPSSINIENAATAKIQLILNCKNLELLKKVQIQIRNFRKPKAFKLQGIYLNDIFPKVKKFVK